MNLIEVTPALIDQLMAIETSCHSHPWSENTMLSCMGGRYFGRALGGNENSNDLIGFYIGEYIAGEATLMDVCVHPNQQGKGLGQALLNHFIEHAEQLGAQALFLEVRASNISAQLLYMKNEFVEISRRVGYYPAKIGYEDAIIMKKTLNKTTNKTSNKAATKTKKKAKKKATK